MDSESNREITECDNDGDFSKRMVRAKFIWYTVESLKPSFTGLHESGAEFLYRVVERGKRDQWTDDIFVQLFPEFLDGLAIWWYRSLPEETQNDAPQLLQAFQQRYIDNERDVYNRAAFLQLTQSPGQSVDDYAKTLVELAMRSGYAMVGDILRDRFATGLLPHLRDNVMMVLPATFEGTLAKAQAEEMQQRVTKQAAIFYNATQPRRTNQRRLGAYCNYCHRCGHKTQQCWQRFPKKALQRHQQYPRDYQVYEQPQALRNGDSRDYYIRQPPLHEWCDDNVLANNIATSQQVTNSLDPDDEAIYPKDLKLQLSEVSCISLNSEEYEPSKQTLERHNQDDTNLQGMDESDSIPQHELHPTVENPDNEDLTQDEPIYGVESLSKYGRYLENHSPEDHPIVESYFAVEMQVFSRKKSLSEADKLANANWVTPSISFEWSDVPSQRSSQDSIEQLQSKVTRIRNNNIVETKPDNDSPSGDVDIMEIDDASLLSNYISSEDEDITEINDTSLPDDAISSGDEDIIDINTTNLPNTKFSIEIQDNNKRKCIAGNKDTAKPSTATRKTSILGTLLHLQRRGLINLPRKLQDTVTIDEEHLYQRPPCETKGRKQTRSPRECTDLCFEELPRQQQCTAKKQLLKNLLPVDRGPHAIENPTTVNAATPPIAQQKPTEMASTTDLKKSHEFSKTPNETLEEGKDENETDELIKRSTSENNFKKIDDVESTELEPQNNISGKCEPRKIANNIIGPLVLNLSVPKVTTSLHTIFRQRSPPVTPSDTNTRSTVNTYNLCLFNEIQTFNQQLSSNSILQRIEILPRALFEDRRLL